ncbi:hypothetical protein KC19_6G204300 [Ceratodon purpureus]|uniref:Formiminotransferase N-terminal subdomain domain-containing protein n=1 Tax=Ceratodon purpureus TaxID=3225 RepID=A0A8T0HJQ4_CERPU|nr:hypothetical protein KC19_6G204300 [Ceratodon purpureus]
MAMAAQPLKRLPLACCKIYISDTRNVVALQEIESSFRVHPKAPLLHTFEDHEYNRVGYTLAGSLSTSEPRNGRTPLQAAVTDVVRTALRTIDLSQHSGSHPRLGVVDHICMHPLGKASMADTAAVARGIASEIGESLQVPAFLYGAAHGSGRPLDDIRRGLGYFQPNNGGLWIGSNIFPTSLQPDFGPRVAPPGRGIVVVGACPWVMNYNVPLPSTDLNKGKRIARKVSERGGGLVKVQAMALLHGVDCIEIACNLLDTDVSSPDAVQHLVATLAAKEGIQAGDGYLTGHSKDDIFRLASEKLNAFADES